MPKPLKILALASQVFVLGLLNGCGSPPSAGLSMDEQRALNTKYDFGLTNVGGELRLQVKLSLTMPRDNIYLQLPNTFLRKDRLFDRLEDISIISGKGSVRDEKNHESFKLLASRQGERITLAYFVRPYDSQTLKKSNNFYAPIIRNKYKNFVGSMALIVPFVPKNDGQKVPIELNWNLPPQFKIYNSFGSLQNHQKITANFAELWDAVYTAGTDIRAAHINVRGRPVTIALEGHWSKIEDQEFVKIITRLLETQRETWQSDDFPYFFASFLSLGSGCAANLPFRFAGSAHKDSFRAYFPADCALTPEMKQLISHELMHQWIGKQVKMGQKPGHIDGKWLTEGWTDFFGRLMAYRAGVITEQEYFNTLNKVLVDYQNSNERDVTLNSLVQRMYKRGYSNRQLEQVPYQQGEIMAWRLNQQIKSASGFKYSMDDVMRDLLAVSKAEGGSKNFTVAEIEAVIDRYVPGAFGKEYEKVNHGNQPLLPPKLAGCSDPADYAGRTLGFYAYQQLGGKCRSWLE